MLPHMVKHLNTFANLTLAAESMESVLADGFQMWVA